MYAYLSLSSWFWLLEFRDHQGPVTREALRQEGLEVPGQVQASPQAADEGISKNFTRKFPAMISYLPWGAWTTELFLDTRSPMMGHP